MTLMLRAIQRSHEENYLVILFHKALSFMYVCRRKHEEDEGLGSTHIFQSVQHITRKDLLSLSTPLVDVTAFASAPQRRQSIALHCRNGKTLTTTGDWKAIIRQWSRFDQMDHI